MTLLLRCCFLVAVAAASLAARLPESPSAGTLSPSRPAGGLVPPSRPAGGLVPPSRPAYLGVSWFALLFLESRFQTPLLLRRTLRAARGLAETFGVVREVKRRTRGSPHSGAWDGAWLYMKAQNSVRRRARRIADDIIGASSKEHFWSQPPLRVLCLDGGGTKGRNLLVLVRELECLAGKPVGELFDVVCGSSIGGCGALFVAHFGSNATDAAAAAFNGLQHRCFAKTSKRRFLVQGVACEDARAALVRELLGSRDDRLTTRWWRRGPLAFAVATRANRETGEAEPYLFRTYQPNAPLHLEPLPGTCEASLTYAIDATSAAPTFFKPTRMLFPEEVLLRDGGIAFNNPTLVALHELAAVYPGRRVGVCLSLGCGHRKSRIRPSSETVTHEEAERVFKEALPTALYVRLDPPLRRKISPFEHREGTLSQMEDDTSDWITRDDVREKLEKVVERL